MIDHMVPSVSGLSLKLARCFYGVPPAAAEQRVFLCPDSDGRLSPQSILLLDRGLDRKPIWAQLYVLSAAGNSPDDATVEHAYAYFADLSEITDPDDLKNQTSKIHHGHFTVDGNELAWRGTLFRAGLTAHVDPEEVAQLTAQHLARLWEWQERLAAAENPELMA